MLLKSKLLLVINSTISREESLITAVYFVNTEHLQRSIVCFVQTITYESVENSFTKLIRALICVLNIVYNFLDGKTFEELLFITAKFSISFSFEEAVVILSLL